MSSRKILKMKIGPVTVNKKDRKERPILLKRLNVEIGPIIVDWMRALT